MARWIRCRTDQNVAAAMPSMGVAEVAMSENRTKRAKEMIERKKGRDLTGESRRERKRGEMKRGRRRRTMEQKHNREGVKKLG